jgi:hypothetical protein
MKVNDRVIDYESNIGTVTHVGDGVDGTIVIVWDGFDTEPGTGDEYNEDDIDDLGIEVVSPTFEEDFKKVAAKMQEAAKLVREATKLAEAAGVELDQSSRYLDLCGVYDLFGALSSAGWSTSSMMC